MARSKEQWKAQQRALHTQTKTKNLFQMKRPVSGSRPTAPPVNAALFQLGRPATGAPPVSPTPVRSKLDSIQTPSVTGSSSAQAIDLTLDDEEEEDEPMGTQQTGSATNTGSASSVASDAVKLSLLDGMDNKPNTLAQSLQPSDLTVPFAEDVESDVDEDWPEVPQSGSAAPPPVVPSTAESVDDQLSRIQTKEDVMAALVAIRRSMTDGQKDRNLEQNGQGAVTKQQTTTPPLYDDVDDMELEVNEELPNQATKTQEDATNSPETTDQAVRVEHLEDGEIFEEGAPQKSMIQQAIVRDSPPMGAMGMRPLQRNKKQKKRGKKKTKRKLEAMQMMLTPAGEILPDFERTTRQRPFSDAPPPGQYTLAMMRNGTRSGAMNMHPVFQDSSSAPFQPGSLVSGGQQPPMRPPLQHQTPPLPPPLPYEDSQILRVNRQGSMEMLDGDAEQPRHMLFAARPMQGGFKYRTVVSIPLPRPTGSGPSNLLQRSVSDQSRLLPIARSDVPNSAPTRERKKSEDFDLDSLRAAALRSKVNRSMKTSTPTTSAVTEMSSSPKSTDKERHSEPASPTGEDELRLEILRSMKRKRAALKSPSDVQVPTLPVIESSAGEMDVQKQNDDCSKPADKDGEVEPPTQPKAIDVAQAESIVADGACETDKANSRSTLEKNEASNKAEAPSTGGSDSTTPSVELAVTTPEFCPLTACSQSLVIRLSPEDFSPRKGGDENRTKATPSSSLHDAIKEMRRKIAEREKEQTSRLLVNAAGRLSAQSTGSSSSTPSSTSTPSHLSQEKKVSTLVGQAAGATATCCEVSSSVTELAKKPAGVELDNPGKENPLEQASVVETLSPVETATGKGSPAKAMETRELGDTSGDASTTYTDDVRAVKLGDASASLTEKPAPEDAVFSGSGTSAIDFDAVRAEYEQCEAECKEADMHIARLSSEMAALKKQLFPVESTVA
ncbi:hypothetical protein V7S43_014768 [Phytophthora oleae]|uniref:Uncharacterized protein n=1 Tax=Phytophthora oleae TaxID=2107226 RepID=A0ABD3F0B9_9STRA